MDGEIPFVADQRPWERAHIGVSGMALRAVDGRQLAQVADDTGLSLIELAIAFVVDHPR